MTAEEAVKAILNVETLPPRAKAEPGRKWLCMNDSAQIVRDSTWNVLSFDTEAEALAYVHGRNWTVVSYMV